jgi:hypothetical protein
MDIWTGLPNNFCEFLRNDTNSETVVLVLIFTKGSARNVRNVGNVSLLACVATEVVGTNAPAVHNYHVTLREKLSPLSLIFRDITDFL